MNAAKDKAAEKPAAGDLEPSATGLTTTDSEQQHPRSFPCLVAGRPPGQRKRTLQVRISNLRHEKFPMIKTLDSSRIFVGRPNNRR
jgi:hypothetical protein